MTRASKMNMLPKPKTKTTRRLSKADIQRESLNLPPLYSVRSTLWIILLVQASVFALHVHTVCPEWSPRPAIATVAIALTPNFFQKALESDEDERIREIGSEILGCA
jgi:hypothetical protein